MAAQIDFYFDMISPFSYFAHLKLPELATKYGYTLVYHPMDIAVAKIAAGNYGPPNREIPVKMKAIVQDLNRWATYYKAPFMFPKSFDTGRWNIAALYATQQQGAAEAFVTDAWARLYGAGADPSDDAELRGAAKAAGLDADVMLAYMASPKGRADFNKACVAAHARGVFGAPIMMIGEEIWWGNDRMHFLEDYLAAHPQ